MQGKDIRAREDAANSRVSYKCMILNGLDWFYSLFSLQSAREIVEDFQKERNAYEEKIRDLAKLISDLKSTIAFTEKERREWQLLSEIRTK